MKLDAYQEMQASKVDWIENVPSHWRERKITYGFGRIGSGTTPKSDNDAFYDDAGTPWVTTSELRETYITETKKCVTAEAIAAHPMLRVYPIEGVLFAMYGATIGRLGMLGIPATVNQACGVFADPIDVHPRYIFYWLLMRRDILVGLSTGGGQPNLSQDDLRQVRTQVPPHNEQEHIVKFLDAATGKIDLLVAKKRELLELLEEKRRALITRCVTRGLPPEAASAAGLDPHPKLKPSGIDWLGQIPEHWDVKQLRRLVNRFVDYRGRTPSKTDEGVPLITAGAIRDGVIDHGRCPEYIAEEDYDAWMNRRPNKFVLLEIRQRSEQVELIRHGRSSNSKPMIRIH